MTKKIKKDFKFRIGDTVKDTLFFEKGVIVAKCKSDKVFDYKEKPVSDKVELGDNVFYYKVKVGLVEEVWEEKELILFDLDKVG